MRNAEVSDQTGTHAPEIVDGAARHFPESGFVIISSFHFVPIRLPRRNYIASDRA